MDFSIVWTTAQQIIWYLVWIFFWIFHREHGDPSISAHGFGLKSLTPQNWICVAIVIAAKQILQVHCCPFWGQKNWYKQELPTIPWCAAWGQTHMGTGWLKLKTDPAVYFRGHNSSNFQSTVPMSVGCRFYPGTSPSLRSSSVVWNSAEVQIQQAQAVLSEIESLISRSEACDCWNNPPKSRNECDDLPSLK